jgi:hypothetical protein
MSKIDIRVKASSNRALSWLFSCLIFVSGFCHANLQIQSPQRHQIGYAGFMDPGVRRNDERLAEKFGQAEKDHEKKYGLYSSFLRLGSPAGLATR